MDNEVKTSARTPVAVPGRNCWRIEHADRAAFLVDGESYFNALYSAIEQARHSVLIAGWDFDHRILLRRDQTESYFPAELGDLLNLVVKRRRRLVCHILIWDFAMVFELERGIIPIFKSEWRTRRRIKFHLDSNHPFGAAHHQKLVVVDDAVAFVGGLDLTDYRWDTTAHLPDDPRRQDPRGKPYPPFHDVQMAVDGQAAAALAGLFRKRWQAATGKNLRPPPEVVDAWPAGLEPDVKDVMVAIARTDPQARVSGEVFEVENLFLDSIAAARRSIYIENQYLTSIRVVEALVKRLKEPEGPEVMIVLPHEYEGWLVASSMGMLRDGMTAKLRKADVKSRLGIYYPTTDADAGPDIFVHSKVMVVDDDFVRIGSANIANRSMGLDTECDLAIEARGNKSVKQAIADFRNRLLAEHLGVHPREAARAIADHGSIIRAAESFPRRGYALMPLHESAPEGSDQSEAEESVYDPEHAVDLEPMLEEMLPEIEHKPVTNVLVRGTVVLLILEAAGLLWKHTNFLNWADTPALLNWIMALPESQLQIPVVMAAFILSGMLLVPLSIMVIAAAMIFGPVQGFGYSMLGALLSASLVFMTGKLLGRNIVRRLAGKRLNGVSRKMAGHDIIAMAAARLIPLATFPVISIVAGASRFRYKFFIMGTLIGMTPMVMGLSLIGYLAARVLTGPDFISVSLLASASFLYVILAEKLRQRLSEMKRP